MIQINLILKMVILDNILKQIKHLLSKIGQWLSISSMIIFINLKQGNALWHILNKQMLLSIGNISNMSIYTYVFHQSALQLCPKMCFEVQANLYVAAYCMFLNHDQFIIVAKCIWRSNCSHSRVNSESQIIQKHVLK